MLLSHYIKLHRKSQSKIQKRLAAYSAVSLFTELRVSPCLTIVFKQEFFHIAMPQNCDLKHVSG